MEIKINREIRDYKESIFFGMNLRQLVFAILAAGAAVAIYFLLHDILGTETTSWLRIIGAFPFVAVGFVKYNGMSAGQFAMAYIKSEILMPKHLCFQGEDTYYLLCRDFIENRTVTPPKANKAKKKEEKENELKSA